MTRYMQTILARVKPMASVVGHWKPAWYQTGYMTTKLAERMSAAMRVNRPTRMNEPASICTQREAQ